MTPSEPEYRLRPVDRVELRLTDGTWAFAQENQIDIAKHWDGLTTANPTLFNGNLLLMVDGGLSNGLFKADLIEVDYASFITWRDWGWCDKAVHDCYGCAVLMSSDGALVMGRMGNHTINAGMIYPPGGSLTREDLLQGGAVDMTASIARELVEETGLAATDATPDGFYMAASDQRIAIGQVLRFNENAETMAARVWEHIAAEAQPELSEVIIMRRLGDVDPQFMPPHARAFSTVVLENTSGAR
ncbi:MAG: NUDIX hydrolase [Alphaproteobacteria bacterium]|nr:NUDIX hydrolase [Alphaproteobacteria bacterium]